MKIQQSVLFLLTADNLVIISLKLTCPFHDIAEALNITEKLLKPYRWCSGQRVPLEFG
jgi:hypothetical protein